MKPAKLTTRQTAVLAFKSAYYKRWTIPYTKSSLRPLVAHNEAIERAFMNLLLQVKMLYSPRKEFVFDYNGKHDRSVNCTTMYNFITCSLYLELECEFSSYKCHIYYDFERCPFEQQIKLMLTKHLAPEDAIHSPRDGGVAAYFKRVQVYHEGRHCCQL